MRIKHMHFDYARCKQKGFSSLVLIVVFVLLGGGLFYAGYQYSHKQTLSIDQPTSTPVVVATPTPDPTANWKTYTGKYYSFKYPSSWTDVGSGGDPNLETAISNEGKGAPLGGTINHHVFLMLESSQGTNLLSCSPTNISISNATAKLEINVDGILGKKYIIDSNPADGEAAYVTVYTIFKQNRCYVLEFLSQTAQTRDSNIKTADQILSTFRFDSLP